MITGELRNQIDRLWTEFWTGGITNPLMVIEQISFLMFSRLLDIRESREEKRARRINKSFHRIFSDRDQECRWSHFKNITPAEALCKLILNHGVITRNATTSTHCTLAKGSSSAPSPSHSAQSPMPLHTHATTSGFVRSTRCFICISPISPRCKSHHT